MAERSVMRSVRPAEALRHVDVCGLCFIREGRRVCVAGIDRDVMMFD